MEFVYWQRPIYIAMKHLILTLVLSVITSIGFAQSKKISKNKINERVVTTTAKVDGKEIVYKESVERYNKFGKKIEEIKYTKTGEIKERYKAKYEGENIVEEIEEEPEKKFYVRKIYKYNNFDDVVEEYIYDINNKLKKKHVYTYNKFGLKQEMREFDANNQLMEIKQCSYSK